MPRNESNIQPPGAIDRAGMYGPDIQEFRRNFRALFEGQQKIEAALLSNTATTKSLLEAYNGTTGVLRAMNDRLQQLTARVEDHRDSDSAIAKATSSELASLISELESTIKGFLEEHANIIVSGQQDVADIVQRAVKNRASLPANASAQNAAKTPASAAPRVDTVPSIDAVLALLPDPHPKPLSRSGRRNWQVGRFHIIEARINLPDGKPITSLSSELKAAIVDIKDLRRKGHVPVVAFPSSLHALTQADPSWFTEATRRHVFVFEPQHLPNFLTVALNRERENGAAGNSSRLHAHLTEIGEELRAIPGTEHLRGRFAEVIRGLPAPAQRSPDSTGSPQLDNGSRATSQQSAAQPSPSRGQSGNTSNSRPDNSRSQQKPQPTNQPTPDAAAVVADIFDQARTQPGDTATQGEEPPPESLEGTHTQRWPDEADSQSPDRNATSTQRTSS